MSGISASRQAVDLIREADPVLADLVEELRAAVRRESFEDCATIAEEVAADGPGDGDRIYRNGYRAAAKEIAAAIRRGGRS